MFANRLFAKSSRRRPSSFPRHDSPTLGYSSLTLQSKPTTSTLLFNSTMRTTTSLLVPFLSLAFFSPLQTIAANITRLSGTWSSGSGAVLTGKVRNPFHHHQQQERRKVSVPRWDRRNRLFRSLGKIVFFRDTRQEIIRRE